jgi:protein-S-isoprenylcysteine O-methyltransferase Ste14
MFLRVDGPLACWLPAGVVRWAGWSTVAGVFIGLGVEMFRRRIVDEEGMLKGVFGKEWEDYHRKTKRFIPYVF